MIEVYMGEWRTRSGQHAHITDHVAAHPQNLLAGEVSDSPHIGFVYERRALVWDHTGKSIDDPRYDIVAPWRASNPTIWWLAGSILLNMLLLYFIINILWG